MRGRGVILAVVSGFIHSHSSTATTINRGHWETRPERIWKLKEWQGDDGHI